MKNICDEKGQTTIEVALVMILLLVLFFGIAEIARAWWLKNQINNAARVAVRVAIVTPDIINISFTSCSAYSSPGSTPSEKIGYAACGSITNTGLHDSAEVALNITDDDSSGGLTSSDTVTVTVRGQFVSVVPNLAGLSFGLFPASITMSSDAAMRYE